MSLNDEFFQPQNLVRTVEHWSQGELYHLVVRNFKTKEGCWEYTMGEVFDKKGDLITTVKRNYHKFPFAWAMNHKNGHHYLLCGENYQGQTVIELDTGTRRDCLPKEAEFGGGFCWTEILPSPDRSMVAACGCYWGGPFETFVYDFAEPLKSPLPLIGTSGSEICSYEWGRDNVLYCEIEEEVRASDKKPFNDLTEIEEHAAMEQHDFKVQRRNVLIGRGGA